MVVLPRWRVTTRVMSSYWSVAWLPLLYAILVVPRLDVLLPPLIPPPRLEPIAALLGEPDIAVIAWVHFVAFDLFVGRWVYLDALRRQVPIWWTAPILFLVLMFGPFGLLAYLLLRGGRELVQVEDQKGARAGDRRADA